MLLEERLMATAKAAIERGKLSELEDELHETASANSGLHDFGDPSYRDAFRALLNGFDTDVNLSERGREFVCNFYFLGPLIARLYTEKGLAEHPEVLSMPIKRPLVILGLPRTGTTALHKLLSMDPQFQGPEYWLVQRPIVRPLSGNLEEHPTYATGDESVRMINSHIPGIARAHDTVTDEVDECKMGLCQSFTRTELTAFLPSYGRWYQKQDRRNSFRRYADVLRLIGSSAPERRWLLKDPHHLFEIDSILDVFPDACIIHTHRDPVQSIPSICSLWYIIEQAWHGEHARPDKIGPREIAYWRRGLDCLDAGRRRRPEQFFDVDHREFSADPLASVRSLYAQLGLTLTPVAEQKMRQWIAASPTTKHGPHRYGLEDWGITSAEIRELFNDYREQHRFN